MIGLTLARAPFCVAHKHGAAMAILLPEQKSILLLRRKSTSKRNALCWELPGGTLEEEERAKDAAIREIKEETGFSIDRMFVEYIGSSNHKAVRVQYFVGILDTSTAGECQPADEYFEYCWFKEDAFKDLLRADLEHVNQTDITFIFSAFDYMGRYL